MYLVRPSQLEIDAIAGLNQNQTGSTAWSWESLFLAMKKVCMFILVASTFRFGPWLTVEKSETFTAPSPEIQQEGGIQYNLAFHGTSGPLHYSYPG
jgi:hypothetical protein